MQEIKVWPYQRVVYAQLRIRLSEWDAQTSLGFWDTNGSPNLGKTTRSYDSQHKRIQKRKKRTNRIVDFAVPLEHSIKLKEHRKRDKYRDLTRELKNYWTMIPVMVGALRTIFKGSRRFRNQRPSSRDHPDYSIIKIGQNTEESLGDLRKLAVTNSCEKPLANAGVKN